MIVGVGTVDESIFCMGISTTERCEPSERSPLVLKQDDHSGMDPTFVSWLLIYPSEEDRAGVYCWGNASGSNIFLLDTSRCCSCMLKVSF
jgi:hypothetical protein